ncbi:TD and POZ domain-containing protein 4-like [Argiope bruennichi]|uniref:TD and POZ domain-containing protein 4-like n=1 Tax=Argiope bruennichi TaxID=94029 RepID=UPI00249466D2|nr:TD and POZ domain-containing protein 4-like [Argiope bruennichi]
MPFPEHFAVNVINQLSLHLKDIDFRELFNLPLYSDVIVCYRNQKFFLHKLILSARSPFFARLLQTEKGQKCAFIRIHDTSELIIFHQVLFYIYSLKIPQWYDGKHLRDLYRAAKLFELKNLSEFCIKELWNQNGVRFIKLATIAVERDSEFLKNSLCKIFKGFWPTIRPLSNWQTFVSRYPDFASKLLNTVREKK